MANAIGTMAMTSLRPLMKREKSGKSTDFEEVYRTCFDPVYAFVAYRVGSRQAAEDITSQVFEKAFRSYSGFDPGRAAVSTWLFTIARNAVFDHFRGLNRRMHLEFDERIAASSSDDPSYELEAGERQRELAAAMSSLEDREQELLALKFGAGLTNRQIAGLIDTSESNVGTILYRSLGKLKTKLEGGIDND